MFAKPYARKKVNDPNFSKLPAKEQEFWKKLDKVTTFVLTGGRGSGKSIAVEVDSHTRGSEFGHCTYYTRYTNETLETTVKADFDKVLNLVPIRCKFQSNKIEYPSGGLIKFKGLKAGSNSQTAKGKGISMFNVQVVEEAEEHPSLAEFDKMKLSLRRKDLPNYSILLLNPTSKEHWIYKEFFEDRGVNGGTNAIIDEVCYIHTTYLDVDREHHTEENWNEYERGRKAHEYYRSLTDDERLLVDKRVENLYNWYKFVVLGGWLDKADGVVFKDWETGVFPADVPYCYGLDFGWSPDPTACCKVAVDEKEKKIYVEETLYRNELSNELISQMLKANIQNPDDLIVADHSQREIVFLRGEGFNVVPADKGHDSVRTGVKDLLSYTIVVCGLSKNFKIELNNYVWNDKKAGIPVKAYGHLIDAMRYAKFRLSRQFFVK